MWKSICHTLFKSLFLLKIVKILLGIKTSHPIFTEGKLGGESSALVASGGEGESGGCESNCGVVIPTFLGVFLGIILLCVLVVFLIAYRRRRRGKSECLWCVVACGLSRCLLVRRNLNIIRSENKNKSSIAVGKGRPYALKNGETDFLKIYFDMYSIFCPDV